MSGKRIRAFMTERWSFSGKTNVKRYPSADIASTNGSMMRAHDPGAEGKPEASSRLRVALFSPIEGHEEMGEIGRIDSRAGVEDGEIQVLAALIGCDADLTVWRRVLDRIIKQIDEKLP